MVPLNVSLAVALVLVVGGLTLRLAAMSYWAPIDGLELTGWLLGALVGIVLTLAAVLLRTSADTLGSMVPVALLMLLGASASGAAMAVGVNGLFDRSPGADVSVVVVHPGQRRASVRVTSGDATGVTFDTLARIGTYREGQVLIATLHRGALGHPWCERVR